MALQATASFAEMNSSMLFFMKASLTQTSVHSRRNVAPIGFPIYSTSLRNRSNSQSDPVGVEMTGDKH